MKIFINDIPVSIKKLDEVQNFEQYNHIVDGKRGGIDTKKLQDDVLVINASKEDIDKLLQLMTKKKLKDLDAVTFAVSKRKATINHLKEKFNIVEAAGGVVEKGDQILLIHRLGKWDFPKGKLEKKETPEMAAVREVEEECRVKVLLGEKICATYHTYIMNEKYILKKTHWYRMDLIDDSQMTPQKEENIDELRWMEIRDVRASLYNSYRSIRHVAREFYKVKREAYNS
ncbi:NUDIX hydrolase [Imperialibacter roseus]|jgi:8-oxo-(d)GTP phosphatase|uniref:NUDIX hydrolase n=1 Tax=Imperialibacter roseus TaxID=1324217 RepID=A0ABZ0IJ45_9BACT|nr:NUDIX hydrolase [Imperialibacter roseus]WOK04340.1 NUDIX hydrolase [Imperialibacter roseus]|tara:strand:+ start:440 stop:1126 length:687 start_codon:yes stop_codon:yes gene_type:complete